MPADRLLPWLALGLALTAAASPPVQASVQGTVPRIDAGRETEVLTLLGAYRDEKEIVGGWRVTAVQVPTSYIRIELTGPGDERAALLLKHPTESKARLSTASFALEREGPQAASEALDRLSGEIGANDGGGFWPDAHVRPAVSESTHPVAPRESVSLTQSVPLKLAHIRSRVARLMGDGLLHFAVALLLTLVHLRRVLRQAPRWVPWALLGLVGVGAALRYALSPETVMNAWPYARTPPLVRAMMDGEVLPALAAANGLVIHLTDAIHLVDFVIAVVTPVAFFAHARFALDGWKPALFAAALLVFLPLHIHFSRSDVEYVQSLATSSLTFVALYTSLRDPSRAWRVFALALLPLLSLATYSVRPENMVFAAVDVGAILLTAGRDVPPGRRLTVLGVVVGVATYSFVTRLLVDYGFNVGDGLSWTTLGNAAMLVFDRHRNTLINVSITPVVVSLLAVAGFVHLVRSGQKRRAVYLAGWLASFFVVHAYVVPNEPAMMARYHMHLITPLLLLAAAALPLVWSAPRVAAAAVGVAVVLSPAIHHPFITRADFMIMREYDLIRTSRHLIPEGCTVLEFMPVDDLSDPNEWHPGNSRLLRHGAVLRDGRPDELWTVVSLAEPRANEDGSPPAHEELTLAAHDLLDSPPSCLVFLQGMTCHTHRPDGTDIAPACSEVLHRMQVETLAELTAPLYVYDERNAERIDVPPSPEKLGHTLYLALHRLSPKDEPTAPAAAAGDAP